MWYIIPRGMSISQALAEGAQPVSSFNEAREEADALRHSTGNHYHVIKIQMVWTTTTLADLLEEDGSPFIRKGV